MSRASYGRDAPSRSQERTLPGVEADDALRCFPIADTPTAWDTFLDDVVLAFGGLDLLVTARDETRLVEQSAALLALSPAGGRNERVGAPTQVMG